MKKILTAKIPADLIDKCYKAQGWIKIEGEQRTLRVKTVYALGIDHKRGVYTATLKP